MQTIISLFYSFNIQSTVSISKFRIPGLSIGLNESTIPQCNSPITTTTTTTSSETTRDTTHVTTLENPTTNSIWEMYNKLLVYVVVGAGCALGLLLIFIVMLCLLTGCVANKRRRYRVQRKHQLETAPSQGRAANPRKCTIMNINNISKIRQAGIYTPSCQFTILAKLLYTST